MSRRRAQRRLGRGAPPVGDTLRRGARGSPRGRRRVVPQRRRRGNRAIVGAAVPLRASDQIFISCVCTVLFEAILCTRSAAAVRYLLMGAGQRAACRHAGRAFGEQKWTVNTFD